jgi:hypothetical protein
LRVITTSFQDHDETSKWNEEPIAVPRFWYSGDRIYVSGQFYLVGRIAGIHQRVGKE